MHVGMYRDIFIFIHCVSRFYTSPQSNGLNTLYIRKLHVHIQGGPSELKMFGLECFTYFR